MMNTVFRGVVGPLLCAAAVCVPRMASAGEAIVRGPCVTGLSESSATVRFELAQPQPVRLEVTPVSAPTKRYVFVSGESAPMHVVEAEGLEPSTEYSYVVRGGGAELGVGRFITAPRPGADAAVSFLIYGDTRTDPVAHEAVVSAMRQVPSDFLVNTGDIVERGGRTQDWQTFFDIERALLQERPVLLAIGNHELYDDAAGSNYARYFGVPGEDGRPRFYGTTLVGNVRFFFLNAMDEFAQGEERRWFERELDRAAREPAVAWRVVVLHHGPWSNGPHGPNTKLIDAHIPELLAARGVDLVVSGHDHVYERGSFGAIKYVVSGGGGAPLRQPARGGATTERTEASFHFVEVRTSAATLQMTARRADGSVIEHCALGKGRAWDCDAVTTSAQGVATNPAGRGAIRSPGSSSWMRVPPAMVCFGLGFSALAVVAIRRILRRAQEPRHLERSVRPSHGISRGSPAVARDRP
jgi:hypothetical protein